MPGEYYSIIYYITFGCFSLIGFVSGLNLNKKPIKSLFKRSVFLRAASVIIVAWAFSLFVLFFLCLTPLCVGQDNGDGNNDCALCVFQALLVSIVFSIPAVFLILLSSFAIGKLSKKQDN